MCIYMYIYIHRSLSLSLSLSIYIYIYVYIYVVRSGPALHLDGDVLQGGVLGCSVGINHYVRIRYIVIIITIIIAIVTVCVE